MPFDNQPISAEEVRRALRAQFAPETDSFNLKRFSQGKIKDTGSSFDLAINGQGFFPVLDKAGQTVFTRVGEFGVNKDGFVTDYFGRKLLGYDNNGDIKPIQLEISSITPKKTDTISLTLNLDHSVTPPSQKFVRGFTPGNDPSPSTFTNSASTQVYDSLGKSHIFTTYFAKAPTPRKYYAYIGIDGFDVTPKAAHIPEEGTPANPAEFMANTTAEPFTLLFDSNGNFVKHSSSNRAEYYGKPPVISTAGDLVEEYTLKTLDIGDLTINGCPIYVNMVTDTISTTDNSASMITLVDAINRDTSKHKVTAFRNPNILDMPLTSDAGTANGVLSYGDLAINNIDIVGDIKSYPGITQLDKIVNMINNIDGKGINGITASNNNGALRLVADDSRNIHITTDGCSNSGLNFTNFSLTGGEILRKVKRGSFSLSTTDNMPIIVGGNNPGVIGLEPGIKAGIFQSNSDKLEVSFDSGIGLKESQKISIDMNKSTLFASPFSITSLVQDGYSTGRMYNLTVDDWEGKIVAHYGNGQKRDLAQIALAHIPDVRYLTPLDNYAFATNSKTGKAVIGKPGTSVLGVIKSHALETIKDNDGYKPQYPGKTVTFAFDNSKRETPVVLLPEEQMEVESKRKLKAGKLLTESI